MTESLSVESILDHWHRQGHISRPGQLAEFLANRSPLDFAAQDTLVHAGSQSTLLFFVHSGLLRLFYTSSDGKERNKAFFGPGHFVGPVSAAITGNAAPFTIQALEDTTVLAIDFHKLYAAAPADPELGKSVIALLSEAFIRNEQREAILLTGNAEQRYRCLEAYEPELLAKLPQFHIASYLGVDAVSLSRLKRKLKQETL